jgi:hypothetical protein
MRMRRACPSGSGRQVSLSAQGFQRFRPLGIEAGRKDPGPDDLSDDEGISVPTPSRQVGGFGQGLVRRNPRLRPRDPARCGTNASAKGRRRREEQSSDCETAERRTARASALTGSPRGKPEGTQAPDGSRRSQDARTPGSGPLLETARRGLPRPSRLGDPRAGTVGAGSDAGPHYFVCRARDCEVGLSGLPRGVRSQPAPPPNHP